MKYLQSVEVILEEYNNSNSRLKGYHLKRQLRRIPDQLIIEQIGMAEMSKIVFVLWKKYEKDIELVPLENDLMLRIAGINVANMSYLAVHLQSLTISDQLMRIEGNISVPAVLNNSYMFYAKVNGRKTEAKLEDCGLDLRLGGEVYERRTVFRMEVPLAEQHYVIEFFNLVDGAECYCSRINSLRFAPVADCVTGQYYSSRDWIVQIIGNKIVCHKAESGECLEYERKYQEGLRHFLNREADWVIELRNQYFELIRNKKRPMWLIMDRNDRADDNGEVFFKYMQQHREVDTYFVIREQCRDYKRLQEIGKVVPLYSRKHYLLVLLADCVISSQCNGFAENPFWENAEYFRDLYHRPYLIFLQHGVIKDDMSLTLNRFHTNLSGFVTSTEAEYRSLLKYPYYYDEKNIWLTGLPLLDELENNDQRYIVIAPTWRKGLMRQEWNKEMRDMLWVPAVDIKTSDYYKAYRELLTDSKLISSCKKNAYKLVFKPHPLMEPYIKEIVEDTEVLFMGAEASYRDVICSGSLLVTDYSSLAFEFAYLGKSTLYYQFDKKSFFAAHTYKKGYFDYEEDGFGEVCSSKKELVRLLTGYMDSGCTVRGKYRERIRQLYPFRGGACGRLYERIKQITAGER